jgi:PIN domain nuclease of toxin-antitoxin system
MNLLLDTCALLALAGQVGKLPRKASLALAKASTVFVSTVTPWEIAIKFKSGKLQLSCPVEEWFSDSLLRYELEEIKLSAPLLCRAADLPLIHRDPFDRVLVATALQENLVILTSDSAIPMYPGIRVAW